ncbi:MAG: hypothetical protein ACJ74Y_09425 [Bryobacteraceae bacterium]
MASAKPVRYESGSLSSHPEPRHERVEYAVNSAYSAKSVKHGRHAHTSEEPNPQVRPVFRDGQTGKRKRKYTDLRGPDLTLAHTVEDGEQYGNHAGRRKNVRADIRSRNHLCGRKRVRANAAGGVHM